MTSLKSSRTITSGFARAALNLSAICLATGLFSSHSHAFSISPFTAELRPSGLEASRAFTVENRYDQPIAVQITLKKRSHAVDGTETRTATDELVASPEQLSLKAGEKRIVRVTYVGNRDLKEELPFRVSFEQLPIDLKKPEKGKPTGAQFQFVFNYVASLYVAPAGLTSDLKIEETKVSDDGTVQVLLKNHGGAHQQLSDFELGLVLPSGQEFRGWEKETLETLAMVNVLAGAERALKLKLPKDAPKGAERAALKAILKKKPQA